MQLWLTKQKVYRILQKMNALDEDHVNFAEMGVAFRIMLPFHLHCRQPGIIQRSFVQVLRSGFIPFLWSAEAWNPKIWYLTCRLLIRWNYWRIGPYKFYDVVSGNSAVSHTRKRFHYWSTYSILFLFFQIFVSWQERAWPISLTQRNWNR